MKLVEAAGRNDQLMTTRRHEKAPALSQLHAGNQRAELTFETGNSPIATVSLHLMMTRIGVKFRCKVVVSARKSTLLILTTEG